MKTYIMILITNMILMTSVKSIAEEVRPPHYFPNGEKWVDYRGETPKLHYPIIIQGAGIKGGSTYRAIFTKIPSPSFEHKSTFGSSDKEYNKLIEEYSKGGFTLIYHQTFTGHIGTTHQAIWIKQE